MIRRIALTLSALAAFCVAGCQVHPRGIVDALTPETVQIGVTAPNAINGPIATTRAGQSRRDSFGQIGVSLSATYRLKPLRIERAEVQPVRVVPTPTPKL